MREITLDVYIVFFTCNHCIVILLLTPRATNTEYFIIGIYVPLSHMDKIVCFNLYIY